MKSFVRFFLFTLVILACAAPALWAQSVSPKGSISDQIQALQDQNQSLQQRLQALEDKVNAVPAADQASASPEGLQDAYTPLDEGSEYINSESRHFVLSDRTGKDQLRFGGYLFSELALNDQAPGYEPGPNGFWPARPIWISADNLTVWWGCPSALRATSPRPSAWVSSMLMFT